MSEQQEQATDVAPEPEEPEAEAGTRQARVSWPPPPYHPEPEAKPKK